MDSIENNSLQSTEDIITEDSEPITDQEKESPPLAATTVLEENATEQTKERTEDDNVKSTANGNEIKLTHLPLSRIKTIMKLDSDTAVVPLECVFLVTKATELFVQSLAREAFTFTQQNDKKTLQKRDIDSAIAQVESLIFLEETL